MSDAVLPAARRSPPEVKLALLLTHLSVCDCETFSGRKASPLFVDLYHLSNPRPA